MNSFKDHIRLYTFVVVLLLLNNTIVRADDTKEKKHFVNQERLDTIFERLYQLEEKQSDKINIVHLGDSHIQADFFTNAIRLPLQTKFGDGGLGFSFPYSLAKTNGTKSVKFVSDANWENRLNVSPKSSLVDIGLSGIGFYTSDSIFALQLSTVDKTFNTIKLLYSTEKPQYEMSITANDSIKYVTANVSAPTTKHKIKSGESLSTIARRYKTTVSALKRENNLRTDRIQAGKSLKIPSKKAIQATRKMIKGQFDYLSLENYLYSSTYTSSDTLSKITILPKSGFKNYDISGFILENNKSGLIYHTIGVNGAKISDFNKLPLFFEQLRVINPDLIILSFGTNESFQKLSSDQFIYNMRELISRVRKYNPHVTVLVFTPPPSLIRRRYSNTLAKQYQKDLNELTDLVIWDLYGRLEGEKGISSKGKFARIIARDKIHYTQEGYEVQGQMFVEDFLEAYNQYKEKRQKD